jgi:peptide/nickel transport system permease protein
MSVLSILTTREDRHLLHRIHDRIGTGGMVAGGFMLFLIVAATLAPLISPTSPNAIDLLNVSSGSTWAHPLGTDNLGRDILSRLLWGARPSLLGPTLVIGVATIIAVPLAALAGWSGGVIDQIVSRFLDLVFAFPGILLAILAVTLYGPGLYPCSMALALSYMPWIARVTRSEILRERNKPYIKALEVQGLSGFAICARHLVPNVSATIWSQVTISFGYALIDLAALSFLGLNILPPGADWGVMTNNENAILQGDLNQVLYPCLMIILCVTSVTYVGKRLSDENTRLLK